MISLLLSVTLFAAAGSQKTAVAAQPKLGVKTPGVQIPFANLVAEAEVKLPGSAAWLVSDPGSVIASNADALTKIQVRGNKLGEPLPIGGRACAGMVTAFGSWWVPLCDQKALVRIDPKTSKVIATIQAGTSSANIGILAASADSIWMLTDDKTTLSRIDPEQDKVVGETRLPAGARALTPADNALWVAVPSQNKVLRISTFTNLVEKQIDVSATPEALAASRDGALWVLCKKDGKLEHLDTKTNTVIKTIDLGIPNTGGALTFGEGSVWITMKGFPLTRVDPAQDLVVQQFYGAGGSGAILTTTGALWLSDPMTNTVKRIDPKRVLATLAE